MSHLKDIVVKIIQPDGTEVSGNTFQIEEDVIRYRMGLDPKD